MKKLFAILMVLAMMFSIVACAETTDKPNPSSSSTPSTPSTPSSNPNNPPASTVMTHAEYMAAEADEAVKVECYVQATQSWWDNKITIYAQDKHFGGYFAYEASCTKEVADKLVPGTKVIIEGYKTFYKGMPEIASGATLTIVEDGDTYEAPASILTDKLGTQDLVKEAGVYAAFQGLTIAKIEYRNGEPGDDIYVDFTLNDKTYSFCVERYLTDPETDLYKMFVDEDLKVGDVVNVYGFVYWYDADEDGESGDGINTHITKITKG